MKLLKFLFDAGLYDEFMEAMEEITAGEKDLEDYEKNPEKYNQEEIEFLKNDLPDFRNKLANIKSDFMKTHKNLDWDREVEDAKAFKVTPEQFKILYGIIEKLKTESVGKNEDEKSVFVIEADSDAEFESLKKIIFGPSPELGLRTAEYETYFNGRGWTNCFQDAAYNKTERTFRLTLTNNFKKFVLEKGYF